MIERMLTVIIGIPIVFACTYFGEAWFAILVTTLAIVSLNEFYNLLKNKGLNPYYTIGNVFTFFIITFVHFTLKHPNWEPVSSAVLTSAVIIVFITALFSNKRAMAVANVGITLLGILYIGWLMSFLVLLRALNTPGENIFYNHGPFLFLLMFSVWANDMAAYVVGKTIGKRQLSPFISPKKTIEGAVAGGLAAVATAFVFGMIFERTAIPVNWPHYIVIGIIIAVVSQLSDLCESLIKRDCGAKDSSRLVPGHGGVLDRMDSFIFTAPVLYYYVNLFLIK